MLARLSLHTARLSIRSATPADRADLYALERDPEVMRQLNGGAPVPEEGLADADFLTPRGTEPEVAVIHDRRTGAFVGWIALFDEGLREGQRAAEIGYRLARAAWGRGYGTEAVGAIATLALTRLGVTRLRAETMATNLGSRRVLEKAGFAHVATRPWDGPDPLPGAEAGEVIYERGP